MGHYTDLRGVDYTAASQASVDRFQAATELFHGYYADPIAEIDAALESDPGFFMGWAFKGGAFATSSEKAAEPVVAEAVERLRSLANEATERERGHLAALEAWLAGRFREATDHWGRVSMEHPRDLLALQLSHLGDFYLGRSLMLRDRPARVLAAWDRGVPGFGYVLGMHAFGLEEAGHHALGERVGREALEINPRDPWAVHAVAHVLEMDNRVDEGIRWLEDRANDWSPGNMFAFHNWWHLALHYLERGDVARVLSLYDQKVRPARSTVLLEMVDASALLWRLHLRGIDIGARWIELAEVWSATVDDGYYAFNDVHAMLAFVGAGRGRDAEHCIRTLERAAQGAGTNASMSAEVGLPVARALASFARADYDGALAHLLPVLGDAQRFGGSHAQRDLLGLTALEAALRGGQRAVARALLSQRLAAKPHSAHNLALSERIVDVAGRPR
jgi:hypothetical protein